MTEEGYPAPDVKAGRVNRGLTSGHYLASVLGPGHAGHAGQDALSRTPFAARRAAKLDQASAADGAGRGATAAVQFPRFPLSFPPYCWLCPGCTATPGPGPPCPATGQRLPLPSLLYCKPSPSYNRYASRHLPAPFFYPTNGLRRTSHNVPCL